MRPVVVLTVVMLACSGCPPPVDIERDAGVDDTDGGPVDDGDAVAAGGYCEAIVGFFCPYYLRCGRTAAASLDECTASFLEGCNARFEPSYVSLEAAGLLALSRAGIERCEEHLTTVACEDQLLDLDGPCASMWVGTQPAGAACGFDIESFVCAPGTACVLDVTFCGTCRTVVEDGARCDIGDVACARESTCDDGTCTPRKRIGEACAAGDRCLLGAFCSDDVVCAGPAYVGVGDACDFENRCPFGSECIDGACARAVSLGDACDATTPCDTDGFCDAAQDVCVELVAQGGACDVGAECQTGVCAAGRCTVLPGVCFP